MDLSIDTEPYIKSISENKLDVDLTLLLSSLSGDICAIRCSKCRHCRQRGVGDGVLAGKERNFHGDDISARLSGRLGQHRDVSVLLLYGNGQHLRILRHLSVLHEGTCR